MASLLNSTVTYDSVRAEMRRALAPEEQRSYRGITQAAMTGVMFEELFGINTAEELITAELYGMYTIPSDDAENLYLFSAGHGLTAKYNSEFSARVIAEAAGFVPTQTIEDLHNIYQSDPRPSTPEDLAWVEYNLDSVATEFVTWWNGLMSGAQTIERRQQGYYCNDQTQHCDRADDCRKTKTIQRLQCRCGFTTCNTENLPLPPYCPLHECSL